MNLKLVRLSLIAVVLLGMLAALSACGKRGDPVRPGDEPEREDQVLS